MLAGVSHLLGLEVKSFRRLMIIGSPFMGFSGKVSLRHGYFAYHFFRISSRASAESSFATEAAMDGAESSEILTAPTFSASNQETMISSCRESETRQFM